MEAGLNGEINLVCAISDSVPSSHRDARQVAGKMMKTIPFDQLLSSDLHVDACYEGGRIGNAGDAPLPRLLRVDNMGGFRKRGKAAG